MSVSVKLVCVDPRTIHHVWDAVASRILRAVQRGRVGLFTRVEQDVLRGDSLLWVAWDGKEIEGAGITSLDRDEDGLVCTIVAWSASDMRRCLPLLERIESYAKEEGCRAVRVYGRRGWARILRDYMQPSIVLEKEL